MTEQLIEIAGQQMVILSQAEFRRLSQDAECYREIAAAVDAQARREAGEEYYPNDIISRIVDGENPLKVWRKYRRLSQEQLGQKVARGGSYIAKLEKGRSTGDVQLWQKLAKALDVDLELLLTAD